MICDGPAGPLGLKPLPCCCKLELELGEIELGTRASSGLRLQCSLGPGAHRLELRHLGLHGCLQSVQPLTCERHAGTHRATRALRERAGLKQLTPGALQALN